MNEKEALLQAFKKHLKETDRHNYNGCSECEYLLERIDSAPQEPAGPMQGLAQSVYDLIKADPGLAGIPIIEEPVHVASAYPPQPTCDTCRFWDYNGPSLINDHNRQCKCPKLVYDQRAANGSGDPIVESLDQLIYWDSEGVSAQFETGPKFGCIHHQRKEQE